MRHIKEDESFYTLQAVIYDIWQTGKADSIFIKNLKNEYDNVIGRSLIIKAIEYLDIIIDIKKVYLEFAKYNIKIV